MRDGITATFGKWRYFPLIGSISGGSKVVAGLLGLASKKVDRKTFKVSGKLFHKENLSYLPHQGRIRRNVQLILEGAAEFVPCLGTVISISVDFFKPPLKAPPKEKSPKDQFLSLMEDIERNDPIKRSRLVKKNNVFTPKTRPLEIVEFKDLKIKPTDQLFILEDSVDQESLLKVDKYSIYDINDRFLVAWTQEETTFIYQFDKDDCDCIQKILN